jgi:hypothetical protein
MIGMRMGVYQVMYAKSVTRRQGPVAIDQTDFRIDEHGGAAVGTADQIGLTAADAELFE